MNRLLEVKRPVVVRTTPLNEDITELQTVHRAWAEKIHKSEDEAFAASQQYARRLVTFRMYYLADVQETDVLVVDGETYAVRGIREIGFRAGTEIAAEWQS
jgi:SPP1 family predicted phage head-tail adaptor